jgi:uncharacterized protein (DUF849 family)
MSSYLPITPQQIADQAIAAAEAGASILHLHARDPETGRPTADINTFREFLPRIKQATDAVINITTGGGHNMTVAERMRPPLDLQPEMCSLNMGSMNFALYPMVEKFETWKHDWEQGYLESTRDFIFKNTFLDIETILEQIGRGCSTRFEYECYDVGHLYNLAHLLDRKLVEPPLFVQTIFGVLGGIGADHENLQFMRHTADKLFGDAYEWSVLAAGRHQMSLGMTCANMGGNVRVGLEDSLYIAKGEFAKSNAEQVTKLKHLLGEMSLEIATPEQVRQRLALKGADNVKF